MPVSHEHRKRMLQHLEEQQREASINATQQKLTKPVGHPGVKGTSGVQRPTELEGK